MAYPERVTFSDRRQLAGVRLPKELGFLNSRSDNEWIKEYNITTGIAQDILIKLSNMWPMKKLVRAIVSDKE